MDDDLQNSFSKKQDLFFVVFFCFSVTNNAKADYALGGREVTDILVCIFQVP